MVGRIYASKNAELNHIGFTFHFAGSGGGFTPGQHVGVVFLIHSVAAHELGEFRFYLRNTID